MVAAALLLVEVLPESERVEDELAPDPGPLPAPDPLLDPVPLELAAAGAAADVSLEPAPLFDEEDSTEELESDDDFAPSPAEADTVEDALESRLSLR